ncbi:hypothetical protein NEOLEDRAFT_1166555 [Neolentinus lepideus HHB14362 ss-1]|uniref:Uncharacterized protein n=1 Tax=Neolentinus lepideus HHB14362 ss-1 TaxID=1314782 RepID=A0A165VGS8_9AGAM|nr:hypothetical protein NEOLEDRAFT_1166555 [Neolentinus lepideus HHB14362 ss-1]
MGYIGHLIGQYFGMRSQILINVIASKQDGNRLSGERFISSRYMFETDLPSGVAQRVYGAMRRRDRSAPVLGQNFDSPVLKGKFMLTNRPVRNVSERLWACFAGQTQRLSFGACLRSANAGACHPKPDGSSLDDQDRHLMDLTTQISWKSPQLARSSAKAFLCIATQG